MIGEVKKVFFMATITFFVTLTINHNHKIFKKPHINNDTTHVRKQN